jgi:UDP-2-acetamido-2,6-beta-L-arabino-hexul-4-ose reductase
MKVLVTGSAGFIGKHLVEALRRWPQTRVFEYDLGDRAEDLAQGLAEADVIFHLAGVNRPQKPEEFEAGNAGFTAELCRSVEALGRRPVMVMSSSSQAALDNPYGVSKRRAEEALAQFAARTGAPVVIFRLRNVFGKWCRPNYNSVTATWCYNIAHGLPIEISDRSRQVELVYIDDVIAAFLDVLDHPPARSELGSLAVGPPVSVVRPPSVAGPCEYRDVPRSFKVTLGALADKLRSFRESRQTLQLPNLEDAFTRCLYATYLSYLDGPAFAYDLRQKTDDRGVLAEFIKSAPFGQLFVSRTKPGVTRGNHFHHTKAEKFLVVEGEGIVRFRHILSEGQRGHDKAQGVDDGGKKAGDEGPGTPGQQVIEHRVSGKDFRVVDIPPGYTHSIENVGPGEMVVLFWASEVYDPTKPDTYPMKVL